MISNFIFDSVVWCKKGLCKFSEKNIKFLVPCDFLEDENFAARAAEIADFLELNSQKYTWSPVKCKFQN